RTTESSEALIEKAQQQNLSLLAARISQDVARDNISLASSGHLPSLTLNGDYNYADNRNSNASSPSDYNDFKIGVNLKVPLYTGGKTTSLTKQAEFAYV
ncbi:outer membrane channel protein TolC, partial [Vibrio cholerae]